MLSFKGIDNAAYYRLDARRPALLHGLHRHRQQPQHAPPARAAADHGQPALLGARRCTSTASASTSPPTLARELHDVDRLSAFFDLIQQDPVISQVKLIAEPWDVGEGGYQVGNFPPLWSEWNGKYRDTVRDFWRGEDADARRVRLPLHRQLRPLRRRPAAAPRPASTSSPPTTASPCADLVSYNDKHNEANGEDNRDGESHNRSWNCGVEGPDRRPGDHRACAPASSATSSPRCSSPRACRCCSAATRWAAPRAATTTPTARTTRSPGSTGSTVDDDAARRSPRRLIALPARAPGLPPPPLVPGRADPRRGGARHRLVPARRRADDRRGLGAAASPSRSACSSTATPSRASTRAASRSWTTASTCSSTPTTSPSPSASPAAHDWGERWVQVFDTANDGVEEPGETAEAGREVRVEGRSVVVLQRAG